RSARGMEISAAANLPFRRVLWLMQAAADPRVGIRKITFSIPEGAVASVPYAIPEEASIPSTIYLKTLIAKFRVQAPAPGTTPKVVHVLAAVVDGWVSDNGEPLGPPKEPESADWQPVEPRGEAVRRWIEAQ